MAGTSGSANYSLSEELERRMQIWALIKQEHDDSGFKPIFLNEHGIYFKQRGIYRDPTRVRDRIDGNIDLTVSLLQRGANYSDKLDKKSASYDYPNRGRIGLINREIEATKNCFYYNIPIFYLTVSEKDKKKRDIRLGFVTGWDGRKFYIEFREDQKGPNPPPTIKVDEDPDVPTSRKRRQGSCITIIRDPRFRPRVLERHGRKCAVCSMDVEELLAACHIQPVGKEGSDKIANSLVLCYNHHRAFDSYQFSIEPTTKRLLYGMDLPTQRELKIETDCLDPHIANTLSIDSLRSHWEEFTGNKYPVERG